jgi:hypothetical protein
MSKDFADCPSCCTIVAWMNGYETADIQYTVRSQWTQFAVNLGVIDTTNPVEITVSDNNCYAENIWLDDFGLAVS